MKRLLVIGLALCALGVATPAAADDAKGCVLQGTFMGVNSAGTPVWTGVYVPLTGGTGITDVTFVGLDLTLGGWFENAVRDTGLRGTWVRTGGNSFAVTLLSIAADAAGATQYIAKVTGEYTMLDGCSRFHLSGSFGIYLPNMNPLTDSPIAKFPLEENAYRVTAPSKQ